MVQVNLEIVLVNLHAVEETRALAGRADDEHVLVDGGGRFNRAVELQGVDGFTRQAVQQHEHAMARRLNNPALAVLVVDCDRRRVAVAAQRLCPDDFARLLVQRNQHAFLRLRAAA